MGVRRMNRAGLWAGAFLLTACAPAAAQAPVHGTAQAKDGDSLMVGGREVRRSASADFVPASTNEKQ
jgi:hypothetical protein